MSCRKNLISTIIISISVTYPSMCQLKTIAYTSVHTPGAQLLVSVIGTGYVGLVTGAGLAALGNTVICADISEEKIALLNAGIMPIYEPELAELVAYGVDQNQLSFTTDVGAAIEQSDIIFIAVNTPMDETGAADLRAFQAVVKTIAEHIHGHKTIVTKSTVPVGTGYYLAQLLTETYQIPADQFTIVSNPEFLREGSAVDDFLHPDRLVIGAEVEEAFETMALLYYMLIEDGVPFVGTNIPTAELIKYASNAFLAAKLSFINEIANLCDATGAHIKTVAYALGLDRRISPRFLTAGPGYGGSCFPKDTQALVYMAQELGITLHIVEGAIRANSTQQQVPVHKLNAVLSCCEDKTIALLGLAFKANTDDIRYSPALTVIRMLLEQGACIRAYDPEAMRNSAVLFPTVHYCNTMYEAVENADALIIMTEWDEFKHLNLERVKGLMHGTIIIDARNLLDAHKAMQLGFYYDGIGQAIHYQD